MLLGRLFLNETYAIEVGMWLFGIPVLLVYLLLLKVLLTRKSRGGRIASAGFLCLLAGAGYAMDVGTLITTILAVSALLGVAGVFLFTPESPEPGA